jgi:hypothetical protein
MMATHEFPQLHDQHISRPCFKRLWLARTLQHQGAKSESPRLSSASKLDWRAPALPSIVRALPGS